MKITKEQQNEIGLSFILEKLLPDSPYGAELKRTLAPEANEKELSELAAMMDSLQREPERFERIRRVLMQLKEIRGSLKSIEEGTASDVDFFEVKRFLLRLRELCPIAEDDSIKTHEAALSILDPTGTGTATFSIEDCRSPLLEKIRREKALAAGDERVSLAAEEEREQRRVRKTLCTLLAPFVQPIYCTCSAVARLDFTLAKARLALKTGAIVPKFGGDRLLFTEMTNPLVVSEVESGGGIFCPITIELKKGSTVITGANMGGKTVVLHTLGLNICLAHLGLAVYAKKAEMPRLNQLFLIHEQGDKGQGLSDFGMEMVQCNKALLTAKKEGGCLILFDEPARGTNPLEGSSIAAGIVSYCNSLDCYALFTTHFDGVARHGTAHYQIAGLKHGLSTETGIEAIKRHMDYTLKVAAGEDETPHDALNICRLIGLPDELIERIEGRYR